MFVQKIYFMAIAKEVQGWKRTFWFRNLASLFVEPSENCASLTQRSFQGLSQENSMRTNFESRKHLVASFERIKVFIDNTVRYSAWCFYTVVWAIIYWFCYMTDPGTKVYVRCFFLFFLKRNLLYSLRILIILSCSCIRRLIS